MSYADNVAALASYAKKDGALSWSRPLPGHRKSGQVFRGDVFAAPQNHVVVFGDDEQKPGRIRATKVDLNGTIVWSRTNFFK